VSGDDERKRSSSRHIPGQSTRERREDERRGPGAVGDEPDPRFSMANERTFLAWNRTALALIAAGAAAAAFLKSDLTGVKLAVSVPLIVLGALVAAASYRRWDRNERAMRLGDPLEYDAMPSALTIAIVAMSLVIAVVVVVDLLAD
jgi:putative membrane protein